MEKVEHLNKMLKISYNRKKNARGLNTRGKTKDIKDDSISLSSKAVSLSKSKEARKSPDIRMDMVEKYREEISSGEYKIKTDEIVEKMVLKLQEDTYFKRLS